MSELSRRKSWTAAILLIFSGLLVGVIICEAAYRFILYNSANERFVRSVPKRIVIADSSQWVFSEEFGYGYPPKRIVHHTELVDGRVVDCRVIDNKNEMGNSGPIVGSYQDAEIKIAVFGASFTAANKNNQTWSLLLQEALERKTGKKVHVLNFGRDGYGVLQMFDLAAAKVPEWQPDIAIIAFTSKDFPHVRTWRTETLVDGAPRILTTFEPKREPDLSTAYDTALIYPQATKEWCEAMRGKTEKDQVIAGIEKNYGKVRRINGSTADVRSTTHSYLLARVLYGNPFHGLELKFPQLAVDTYAKDARFMGDVAKLRESRVKIVLFHLAIYPEIKSGDEYILNYQEANLLRSLTETTGWPIYETTRYARMPVVEPERMNASVDDIHPSPWGMAFYANAITQMLINEGLIQ